MIQCKDCGYINIENSRICKECGAILGDREKNTTKNKLLTAFLILLLLSLVGLTIWLFYYFIIWEGNFEVSQEISKIELGEPSDFMSTLKYDDTEIVNIDILETNFNENEVGIYTITYTVTNIRNNKKNLTFTYEVVDTTAPIVYLKENPIYIKKGADFSIDEFVRVDELNAYELLYAGNLDLTQAGSYDIQIIAVDAKGNRSNECNLTVNVENRDNCVIRNVKFGDSREIVKRYEDATFIKEAPTYLQYSVKYGNYFDANVAYVFNTYNQLYSIVFLIDEKHKDYGNYISNFNNISNSLSDKYGEPSEKTVVKGTYYNYCSDQSQALQNGQVSFFNLWDLEDKTIYEYLANDGDIYFSVVYESKEIDDQENLDNY